MKSERPAMSRVAEMMQWPVRFEPAMRDALRWWLGELAGFVPANLRRRIAALGSRLVLVGDRAGFSLVAESGHEREPLGRIDLRAPATVERALAASRRHRAGPVAVVLRLPSDRALRMMAALPLAADRNLDQVVGFEFERLVPFKRDEAYYAYRVVARDKATHSLKLELTALPRAEIDAIIEAAAEVGVRATAIEIGGAAAGDPDAVMPLLNGARGGASGGARRMVIALGSLALVLAVASVALPFLRAERNLDTLSAELAAARRQAELAARLQNQIDTRVHGQRFLVDRRLQMPTVTELLDVLTQLAPDDTWLSELQISGSDLRLTGASASATRFLGLVDQAPNFRNAAFRSPVVQDPRLQRERFDIGAQIAPRRGPP